MELRAQGESLKGCGRHPARGAEWAVMAGAGNCSLHSPSASSSPGPCTEGQGWRQGRRKDRWRGKSRRGGRGSQCMKIRHVHPNTLKSLLRYSLSPTQKTWVQSLGWEDPLEKGMANHSSILAWSIPMDRGAWTTACQAPLSMGSQRTGNN